MKVQILLPGPQTIDRGWRNVDAAERLRAEIKAIHPNLSIATPIRSNRAMQRSDDAGSNPALAAIYLMPGSSVEERPFLFLHRMLNATDWAKSWLSPLACRLKRVGGTY